MSAMLTCKEVEAARRACADAGGVATVGHLADALDTLERAVELLRLGAKTDGQSRIYFRQRAAQFLAEYDGGGK